MRHIWHDQGNRGSGGKRTSWGFGADSAGNSCVGTGCDTLYVLSKDILSHRHPISLVKYDLSRGDSVYTYVDILCIYMLTHIHCCFLKELLYAMQNGTT